jgi:hypothetical protein
MLVYKQPLNTGCLMSKRSSVTQFPTRMVRYGTNHCHQTLMTELSVSAAPVIHWLLPDTGARIIDSRFMRETFVR